ncbi:hypothetical protein [Flavobacterium collinsii]|jgi:hypothetical protein|uniref:Lipoprotein n=1 Tax=Flavobacterium collinsii TaxID=1114861 RepID=A0ABM8KFA1_9FLAO|nr:hypothetical protein [Flavobacterium collinsii]CAA9196006.1 hypothetical protein FLACOL7796_00955 [Flavobacterium collinsii]
MKVIKWSIVLGVLVCSIIILYWIGFAFLYSYGAGSGGTGKIKNYKFEAHAKISINEFRKIFEGQNIIIYDTIVKSSAFERENVIIYLEKEKTRYIISFPSEDGDFSSFMLIKINGQINDDFGWFSLDKYRKVKLFEDDIIEPLSKKYERIEE